MSLLTITNLQKAYISPEGSQSRIIDIPHFEMEEGSQVALKGTSGVGKTTFLNLIAGILGADSGRIIVADEEMTALSESGRDRLRASNIGYIFQTFNLFAGYTALENVILGMMFGRGIDAGFRADTCWSGWGLGTGWDIDHRSYPSGSSNVSRLPAPSPTDHA